MARLTAVDYDPFASGPSLTPVDYDPFAPTLNARASGSAGAVNKKAEAIWGGSFDDWKKRKEADDAERARMVAESEAGNVGSRRAQDFQRKVAALNKEGDQTGDYSADSLRAGRSLEMGMEQGREQIGAGLQFAGETPLALADFFGRIRPKGETEQDRSNPVAEAGKDIRGAAVARQQEIAPLMIDRPESLLSVQGAKYIAQSALQSAPTTGTGLAAAVINPAAGLTLMGAGAGSAKFADARAEDKGYWLSAEAGAAAAAAEVVPEMLPLGFLSGRLLKHLPGTAMKRLASSPAGRGALLSLSEGASEGVTELSNIAYEIAREGKTYTDEQIANRLIDATAVGTVMGGGMAAVAEATGQNARAYDQSKIADLELENSLRAAIKPRATTARILGPTATPDAAAGAQIADDAFRSAGVGTVAAADIAEQDALARDLDAAQRDQLGSEAEIDRLLTGNTPRERTDLYRASIPGAIPQGVQVTSNQDAFAAPGTIGGRDAVAPIQVTTLADRSVFVPGDPVAIRQKLADAGSQWQGMAQERDGVAGVRFSPTSWTDVQGLIGGSIAPTANVAPEVAEAPAAAPPLDLTARRTNSDTKFDERVHDLTDFIALNGGLDRSALESEGIDPANWNSRKAKGQNDKFFGKPLFRKTGGMTLETLREKARDAGFRTDKDVLDLISESLGGRKTFTPAGSEYQMALADVARQEADAQARQQRVNALPLSVPETDADAYIASRETEFDAPADRDGADLADIESTLASVADTSPQQRASVVSLGHDYTAKLIELKRARAAGALNPDQQEAYIDLLEQDRETGKVAGRPMVGIGNKSAYVDAQMQGKLMPVQVFLDADNFKALNDKFGHDVGDDAIRLIADVVRAEFGEGNVFHRGGDEFLTQGMTREEVDAKMARVQSVLANYVVDLPLSDGRTATLEGIGVSYGTGANEKAADESLKQDKQRRKEAGLRFDRREGDGVGRVGSGPTGARTDASRTDANPQDRTDAAAEGVGDERQEGGRVQSGDAGNGSDLGGSGPRTEAVRGGQAGSREVSGGIATVRSAISQALGAKFLRRLESQPWFHLVGTLADLPANIRKSITDGGNVAGFLLGNDVYIIADQASDPVGVTLHEVGVHFGMSGILGADFPAVLRNFKRQRAKDAAVGRAYERATEAAERGEDGELTADALATLDEEALAYYVEANWNAKDARGIVAKVIDAIKSMLNRLGIPLSTLNASPELLRKVAIGAARKAADGRVSVGKDGVLRYHKAWHGSPHDFDKFRLDDSTIGTGEGAQAFGHGLYFAGRKELGEYYRDTLTNRDPNGYALAHLNAKNVVARMGGDAEWAAEVISDQLSSTDESDPNHQRLTDTLAIIKSGEYAEPLKNAGRLYEVELAPDESDYLDWDKPLSEQSEKVRAGVRQAIRVGTATVTRGDGERPFSVSIDGKTLHRYKSEVDALEYADELNEVSASEARIQMDSESATTGEQAYRAISESKGGDREASRALHAAGIPGIRYLDGSSRGGKTGWRVKFKNGQYSGKVFDTKAEADAAVERGEYNMVDRVEKIDDLSHNFVIFDDSQVEVKAKYSRRAKFEPWKGTIEAGTVLYHGSPGELDLTRDDPLYLSDRKSDAGAYAVGLIPGTGKGQKGNPQIIKFIVSDDARVLDANIRINDAVMDMTEETADEAIDGAIAQAKREGYDFVWFEHPSVDGDEMNALIAVDWRNILLEDEGDFQRDYATKPKYSRRADGGSVGKVKTVDVGGFDLPLNPNGTVTLYHHTNEDAAAKIRETGVLRSAGEPTVYVTTEREPTTGYGDAVVAIEVDPRKLSPDDEFPGGRVDFSLDVGRPGGSLRVKIAKDDTRQAPPREGLGASGPRYSRTITVDGKQRPTTDSTGKAIHPTEDGIRNFYAWFKDSKVVDDQGRPLVVYHGSPVPYGAEEGEFKPTRFSGEYGIFFTPDKTYANDYARADGRVRVGPNGEQERIANNVVPVYLKIEKPKTRDFGGKEKEGNEIQALINQTTDSIGIVLNDGVIARNIQDHPRGMATHASDVYVVFDSTQVKSAIGNSGAFGPTDARIAYSRKTPAEARAESAQKQADLGAQLVVSPGQSFVYTDKFTDDWRGQTLKMRERIQDKLLSVRNVQQDIEKIRGAIQDAMNVYRRENLMHGRVGDQRDKLQDSHVKPLIEAMAEAKVSPALLEDYLEARHAKERNEKIAATKGGMPDGASGMTTAQAEDFLRGRAAGHRSGVTLDPAMTRQVSRLARKVYAITSETRRRLLDSGQITQEAFDALENAYAAYVPLRGKDGTEGGKGRGTGKGIDVRGKPIQRAAGRGEGNRAQNILAEVIADAERSIINAEKLRVGRTLARLVLENPNPDVWAIEPVKTELKVSDGTPEEIYEAVKNLDQEEGTIIVKVKGKPYRIVIEDQRMADALKNMAVETVPEVIQYVAGLNRYFSAVLTRYNPSFVGVNMTRDLLFGMTGIWAEHGTAAAAKAAASYFPAMRAAWRDIQGKPPVNAMGRYAREFAEAGGKTYFGKLENVSDMSQRIGEEFKTFRQMAMPKALGGESSPVRALAKVARDSKMVQAIEAVNDTVENTLRLSVYAARREAGASIEQAAEYAKNISVNFNRRGSATSWLNALYLFFNAATQGAHRTLTLLKNPKVQGVLGGLAALQATSAMFLMGLDDDDGEPLWDSISPWDKQRNLILAIPIKREKGWGATVIKIPMPYGFNLFPYMGGRSVELARDLQEKPVGRAIADYTTDAVVGVAQAMSPIPFDDGWKAALPHWVRIFTVLSENKDDLGIPIRAGDQYDSFDKPRSASGRDDTPLPFKIAATALNRLGGGDDYTPPYAKFALDWAPEDLAYLFKTFAGGLGSNVVKSGTLTEKLIAGVPVNFKDVPVLSSFVSNVDQRQATSTRYYDHKDDIEREVARQRDLAKETGEVGDNQMGIKIARNKSGVKVKRGEGYELEGKPGSLFDTYKQAEKDISRIRDEMRAAFNDQSISYTERIRKIDELKAEREEVQRELNAAWREQRKKRTQ